MYVSPEGLNMYNFRDFKNKFEIWKICTYQNFTISRFQNKKKLINFVMLQRHNFKISKIEILKNKRLQIFEIFEIIKF